ncbi:MAG: hypothetical protein PHV42_02520 [Candidatus Pacebacteria bacterium]|nr:hypothetical protein [Candidatus Paceibacterota bacterium]
MKSYRNLFNNLEEKIPSENLKLTIIKEVRHIENRKIKTRFIFSVTLLVASLGGIVEAFVQFVQHSNQSGFSQYASLLFSDNSVFFSYWKDLGLSLVESLPLVSTVLLLGVVLVFLWSGARTLKYGRGAFLTA